MKDKQIEKLIQEELERQQNSIQLIASENIVSDDVLKAMGSILTNRYAEGFPINHYNHGLDKDGNKLQFGSKRYYNGNEVIDQIEMLAEHRFRELFDTNYHVNVQPHSGAQANMAVFEALLEMGDTVLSMDLSNGGHLSHGSPVNYSGKHFKVVQYGINENGEIDYEEVEKLALKHLPNLIICGASNYSKIIDFERFAQIRDKVNERRLQFIAKIQNMTLAELNAVSYEDRHKNLDKECYLLADIAHIAGLVAGGVHPSPFGYADVVTTTTHKSLRGPRGGVIACRQELAKKIDSAVFPGIQGGPLEHVIAGKAVCFKEAMSDDFVKYAEQIVKNSKALCRGLLDRGIDVVGGMTENHLMTVDLRKFNRTGKDVANELDEVGITVNKNTVPNDPQSPFVTSGIRIGTPAVTTRGFTPADMDVIAYVIEQVIKGDYNKTALQLQCLSLCKQHPIYAELVEV